MAVFHTLMMYWGMVRKGFCDAGLADLLVYSEVIIEVIVDDSVKEIFLEKCLTRYAIYQVTLQTIVKKFN